MISAVFQGFRKNHSGSLAKKRLKVVLVTDKADCSPELIDRMKDDMIRVPILDIPNKGIC